MRVAVIQMCSTDDLEANLASARGFVQDAAHAGATFVALPENFAYLCREGLPNPCAQDQGGSIVELLRALSREHSIWLLGGSFAERIADSDRVHNTSVLCSPEGELVAVYRKIHLFDVDLRPQGGGRFSEPATIDPGRDPVVAKTPFGGIGLSICYDLRFPELYRTLSAQGARFLTVPSAFTPETGRDHWEVLLRARAIENQAFVLAPAQWGRHSEDRASYGRALIVDPWGIVLSRAPDRPCVALAECDLEQQDRIRRALPALRHRRL